MRNRKGGKVFGALCTVVSVLAVALMVLVPTQALAVETQDHCIKIIGEPNTPDTVRGNLHSIYAAGGIGGNNSQLTYNSLDSKLSGAITKMGQKKYTDADKKLSEFIEQVKYISDPALTPKPKLSSANANILLNGQEVNSDDIGAVGARECVRDLP